MGAEFVPFAAWKLDKTIYYSYYSYCRKATNQCGIQVLNGLYDSDVSNPVNRESVLSDSCMHSLAGTNRRDCRERPWDQDTSHIMRKHEVLK